MVGECLNCSQQVHVLKRAAGSQVFLWTVKHVHDLRCITLTKVERHSLYSHVQRSRVAYNFAISRCSSSNEMKPFVPNLLGNTPYLEVVYVISTGGLRDIGASPGKQNVPWACRTVHQQYVSQCYWPEYQLLSHRLSILRFWSTTSCDCATYPLYV